MNFRKIFFINPYIHFIIGKNLLFASIIVYFLKRHVLLVQNVRKTFP